MKTLSKLALVILFSFSMQVFADEEPKCPKECTNGCATLCKNADACGVGQKCVTDACGAHCTKDVAN